MITKRFAPFLTLVVLILLVNAPSASADPCGMVPPIYTGTGVPIVRKGLQETYVFYRDGVETFVIRPGYEGKVEDFGMLIPFPTPPALRKVSDNIFSQIANAVDPPEVVVDWRIRKSILTRRALGRQDLRLELAKADQLVRVIKKEAVGMYEVVVLEAGSAKALKRWMDDNGYRYPDGMDKVTNEYVDQGWCFVAVKTKVAGKSNVSPKPAQRKVDSKLPTGAVFDGRVQAMGFRFTTKELVVPMRLSAFNGGNLRNIVYLLTDGPKRIRNIPEEFVQRQLSGKQLLANLTRPLPLRVIGGELKDIPKWRSRTLEKERDPTPKNGVAKELFALDLLAAESKKLSMEHEETEKELLRISEHLGLRDESFDRMHDQILSEKKTKLVEKTMAMIKDMTLTVVDGEFSRKVIAQDNLKFADYQMASAKNNSQNYDAKINGPQKSKPGKLYLGSIDFDRDESVRQIVNAPSKPRSNVLLVLASAFAMILFLGTLCVVTRREIK